MSATTHSTPMTSTDGGSTRQRKARTSTHPTSSGTNHSEAVKKKHIQSQVRSKKPRSFLRRLKRRAIKHTWSIPLLLLVAIASLYALDPTESNIFHHLIFLSYAQDPTDSDSISSLDNRPDHNNLPIQYGKGPWDIAFVAFYTIVLTFTREFIMQELLQPLARVAGIKSRAKQLRFMEQMYTAIYFGFSGPVGLYVMRRTPVWYFHTPGMYEGFPHRTREAVFKFYYLFEAAYWAQQALVMILGMEARRKDFKELVAHHIVTLALIGLSYRFHFTYIGIAIYITHDISDFFLAISKSFHYIDSELVIPLYALNVATWIYLRHYLNLRILYSILTEFRTVGPYELDWDTQQYKCWISNLITFALLALLQSLNLFWLYCLMRSAWRFVSTGEKKDDRSEEEGEEGEQ
ncbi:Sphingosine N-acyltransferase [Penicillium ucsense]|uniref:Sphingosine N-acyltransferase n=1 Tax=Penicillium ucsense TaxID=2839758 RepID=A0A8J8W4E2_9EURO|nr:Sphingosine N-acyltransferase [Penicillium ucsense]KAF7734368.1 Sphingosine N-acyltransferase [Penicillium ucsense]